MRRGGGKRSHGLKIRQGTCRKAIERESGGFPRKKECISDELLSLKLVQ